MGQSSSKRISRTELKLCIKDKYMPGMLHQLFCKNSLIRNGNLYPQFYTFYSKMAQRICLNFQYQCKIKW